MSSPSSLASSHSALVIVLGCECERVSECVSVGGCVCAVVVARMAYNLYVLMVKHDNNAMMSGCVREWRRSRQAEFVRFRHILFRGWAFGPRRAGRGATTEPKHSKPGAKRRGPAGQTLSHLIRMPRLLLGRARSTKQGLRVIALPPSHHCWSVHN